ncbi:hypothetical protein ACQP00_33505 [Dactylosporangium sp. CS-047395]|uniref:hypothetical protein n=1 Tax=Dactylosporangium sp. CS-047395 TaxID=3239936 RepID=UPI003D93D504
MAPYGHPPQQYEKARLERGEARLKFVAAVLGLVTAILGIVAALFAVKSNSANEQADQSQQRVQALESENAALKRELANRPTAQAAGAGTQTAAPTSAAAVAGPAIRHEGDITLVPNSGYDLTSLDPQWGQEQNCKHQINFEAGTPPQISTDGLCSGHSIYVDSLLLNSGDPATYAKCRTSTGYGRPATLNTKAGNRFCLRTQDGYFSLVSVTAVSAQRIDVHVVTWEKE